MKIFVVLPRFPYPLEKGDKLRAYHQIVQLSKHHDIFLFCLSHQCVSHEDIEALRPYCREIRVQNLPRLVCCKNVLRNFFSTKSLQIGYWDARSARRACRAFAQQVQPDVIYSQMVRTMPYVARLPFPKVMDFQDALSLNTERRMEQAHGLWHYLLHFEFKMLRSTEYNAFRIFDGLTIISTSDRDAIPHRQGRNIQVVPNGVDFDYFNPMACPSAPSATPQILFTGNMQYAPNVDACCYLVNDIMPLVWQRLPEAHVTLAGATPKGAVRSLASERVEVTGSVPDMRPYYAAADLFVAPMRMGSGLQNKILEAMAMRLPVVTTSLAALPTGAENDRQLLVGDTPQALADAIVTLLSDEQRREALADEAHTFVHDCYDWASSAGQLEKIFIDAINNYAQHGRK